MIESMSAYRIREYGEAILRKQCLRVDSVGLREREIFDRIARTMYEAQGVGLAACQVGIDRQLMVADVGGALIKLANPLIILREDESILEEGCLSIPGVRVKVKRAMRVLVRGLNEEGKTTKIEGEGLLAHVLQHEIDHLSGVLIVDHASSQEKDDFEGELKELEEKTRLKRKRGR